MAPAGGGRLPVTIAHVGCALPFPCSPLMRTVPFLLAAMLALTAVAPTAIAAPAPATQAPGTLLPTAQRQAVVLMVAARVEHGLAALPQRSPQEALASLRSVAKAYEGMARISREARWPAMASYYTQTSAVFASMAAGKLTRAQVDAKTKGLEAQRRQITKAAIAGFGPAHVTPRDPQLNAIADRLAARVLHDAGG